MSDFDRGFVAAESDLNEGWFSVKFLDVEISKYSHGSVERNAVIAAGMGTDDFYDGYLAFLESRRSS